MELGSRRIVHWGVTESPTLPWVQQQLREATPWGETPRFLLHDIDGVFGQYGRRVTVERDGKKHSYRCHLDRWLHEVMGIEGIPIPYGAPNANAHARRRPARGAPRAGRDPPRLSVGSVADRQQQVTLDQQRHVERGVCPQWHRITGSIRANASAGSMTAMAEEARLPTRWRFREQASDEFRRTTGSSPNNLLCKRRKKGKRLRPFAFLCLG